MAAQGDQEDKEKVGEDQIESHIEPFLQGRL
jgi:hypothetical protein